MIGKSTSEMVGQSKELAVHTYQYYRLKLFATIVNLSSDAVRLVILGALGLLGFTMFSVAGALYLGNLLENLALGFVAMGGIMILFIILIYYVTKGNQVEDRVVRRLSDKFFDE